ncbi:putative ArsR family transcriptional regulator [Streptomyces sp. 1114.5]|uniref:helix-turn-helix transcriptional regulator n=1 Tax=unclassified Streptomyces TaxID=2593676 RepID=UPI000BC812CB|nr:MULTISPECIES: helix-turn-helix domain-containing protein [unclassified Streptomyces]RKT11085.1 putative ArsR family transcriptional regulator [Streptomyces sp. 1114.5]SOB81576.1 Predicted transcriptional regulator, ArsR family [Streptomyces sp. 1331.2]
MREHATQQEAESAPGCDVPVTAAEVLLEGHRATRDRVARSILDHGPSSAADLASRLGLTAAAVRRHLDGLAAAGLVESREQRVYGSRGRGRPAKVFALTDGGRDAFYQAYDQLAADALRWISDSVGGGKAGEEAVAAFARARFGKQGEKYQEALRRADEAERTEALAEALSADGYAATVRRVPSAAAKAPAGAQLCQHHCPVAHIAEQFPQLCEAETEVFSRILGTHVQRLATIAHGDGVCTTYVPAPGAASSSARHTAGRNSDAVPTAGTSTEDSASAR